ncbi:MAG TPA: hypothetical protein VFC86_01430, partial [Planctomycetota bacterium]|nr:hypothetical protein [Planctomycetota bacterium]
MMRFTRWFVATALLAAAFGACKRGGSDDDGPPAAPPAPPVTPPPPLTVDLDVDTNRNGTVHASDDETGENGWTSTQGAVFYFNIDDDDNNNS